MMDYTNHLEIAHLDIFVSEEQKLKWEKSKLEVNALQGHFVQVGYLNQGHVQVADIVTWMDYGNQVEFVLLAITAKKVQPQVTYILPHELCHLQLLLVGNESLFLLNC